LREAGLNPYLFELANIRDQCSWVHSTKPDEATQKAIELVKMSISRSRILWPHEGDRIPIRQNAVILGGGMSGMSAALSLAEQGFDVDMIEKSPQLGGNLSYIDSTLENGNLAGFKKQLIESVNTQRNIDIYLDSEINSVTGHIGDFKVKFTREGLPREIMCGAIIIATGAKPAGTNEYSYGIVRNIMTQLELEKILHKKKPEKKGQTYVMIQCVGSRTPERPYCSRICCSMAVKNALKLKHDDPDARIFILYRDIRTYGFREKYYKEARKAGVIFIRYNEDNLPVVSDIDGILNAVRIESPDYPEPLTIEADKLILSTGLQANEDNKRILC
jgi:heterodisulfide reductase subunit A